jgi:hypothetical protein
LPRRRHPLHLQLPEELLEGEAVVTQVDPDLGEFVDHLCRSGILVIDVKETEV